MKIGVPKEIKPQENRVGLTPESAKILVAEGHEVIVENNTLKVKSLNTNQANKEKYIYKGISSRNFERRFQLTRFMEVNDASMQNGLLTIFLNKKIPKDLQPRSIKISSNNDLKNKAA